MNRNESRPGSNKVNISSSPRVCYLNLFHFSSCLNFASLLQRFTQVTVKHEADAADVNTELALIIPVVTESNFHSTWAD